MKLHASIIVLALLSLACEDRQPREDLGFSSSGADTGGTSAPASSSEEDAGIRLDIGDTDTPVDECESIERSTMLQELPADVIIIADSGVDPKLLRESVANLSPELESDGIDDARVILIAGPPPADLPKHDEKGDCETWPWPCWDPETVPADRFYRYLERDIDPKHVLTDLLALADDWQPLLREESWKHVLVYASRGGDTMTSGPEFAAAFSGMSPSFANFAFHVSKRGDFVEGDFVQLARDTGGVYFPKEDNTGEVYVDFVLAIEDLIKTNPLACVYAIPDPPDGQTFDASRVNVEFDIGLGPETLGYVGGVEHCAEFGHGWYYDDAATPREVIFCPQTCGLFKAQQLASIRIQFGCETVQAG